MAITWGRSNVGGGYTVGTGGSVMSTSQAPTNGGRVLGANTSGGGGNTTVNRSVTYAPAPTPMQPQSQQDYSLPMPSYSEPDVNAIYGPTMSYLDQVESQLRADLPKYEAEAEGQYTTNKSQLDTAKNRSVSDIEGQMQSGTRKYDDAGSAARRLYQEQQMGMQQRFGGSSSAGEAGQAIVGQELQRQLGQNQRSYVDFQSQIARQQQAVNDQYNTDLLSLEQQKQASLNSIRRDFQSKLMEIASNRANVESAKAQMRMQALQDYRNQVYSINLQNAQLAQSIALQRDQAQQTLAQNANRLGGYTGAAKTAYSNFAPSHGTAIKMSASGTPDIQGALNQYMGRIYNPGKNDELIMGGLGTSKPTILAGRSMAY